MNLIIGGVDTHEATHHAAAITSNGALVGNRQFPATKAGYEELTSWLAGHGPVLKVGIEGTGAYGAGVARHAKKRA